MATSSITKNFVISGKAQVETFIAALEAAEEELAKGEPEWRKVIVELLTFATILTGIIRVSWFSC